jgi:hypothetical protein
MISQRERDQQTSKDNNYHRYQVVSVLLVSHSSLRFTALTLVFLSIEARDGH